MLRIATSPEGRGNRGFWHQWMSTVAAARFDALAPPLGELASECETERGRLLEENYDLQSIRKNH